MSSRDQKVLTRVAPTDSESHGRGLPYKAGRQASRHSVTVQLNIRRIKTSCLSDLERGVIVGARRTGSSISETDGFSCTTVSRVYRERCYKQRTSSLRLSCAGEQPDERGRRRMPRILHANRRATNRQITKQYNSGV